MQRTMGGVMLGGMLLCAAGASAALPDAGLFVDVKSRVTDFDTLQLTTTGPTQQQLATFQSPLQFGQKLVAEDSVTLNGLQLTDGMARSGLASGLGVSANSQLPLGLIDEPNWVRRTRVDAKASHVRWFIINDPNSPRGQGELASFDIFLHGKLDLIKQVEEALPAPGNNLLYAFVSIQASIQYTNPNTGNDVFIAGLYDTALLTTGGLTLSPGFQDPSIYAPGFPDAGGGGWTYTPTDGLITAEVDWLVEMSNTTVAPQLGPSVVIPVNEVFWVSYALEVTTFTSFDFLESNATGWEANASFGNTATMDIRVLNDDVELVELTPQVPEPATALVLLPALIGVARRRR